MEVVDDIIGINFCLLAVLFMPPIFYFFMVPYLSAFFLISALDTHTNKLNQIPKKVMIISSYQIYYDEQFTHSKNLLSMDPKLYEKSQRKMKILLPVEPFAAPTNLNIYAFPFTIPQSLNHNHR
jgi:hypothetical protein